MKNRILLENDVLHGEFEAQIEAFVEHDNHQCYHESLNNVTPAEAPLIYAAICAKWSGNGQFTLLISEKYEIL